MRNSGILYSRRAERKEKVLWTFLARSQGAKDLFVRKGPSRQGWCFPFGENAFGGYGKKRYRFTGKERDDGSGLYYFGARYYAPWLCRFTSVDPLKGESPGINPYHYSSNNPINRIDPTGMTDGPAQNKLGSQGPFNQSNVLDKSYGVLARRITTSERKSMDFAINMTSTLPVTKVVGATIGVTYEAMNFFGSLNDPHTNSLNEAGNLAFTSSKEGVLGFGQTLFNAASKDPIVGQNQGMMKSISKGIGKFNVGIGAIQTITSLYSGPTRKETLQEFSFLIGENVIGGAEINPVEEGILNVYNEDFSSEQVSDILNQAYDLLDKTFAEYDLTNTEDIQAAKNFIADNINLIAKQLGNKSKNETSKTSKSE